MIWIWAAFIGLVLFLLALDLGVFHRKAHAVSIREAMSWSAFWIALGLSFSVFIFYGYELHWFELGIHPDAVDGALNDGKSATIKYLTGYIVEKSLSVDNIFVIAMIFGFFAVPSIYQHRVLFWGILGALILRGIMIGAGARLIAEFHWILYLFGIFLVFTGIKMLLVTTDHVDVNQNIIVRYARKLFPVTSHFHREHFIVRSGSPASRISAVPGELPERDDIVEATPAGKIMLTPLALALIMIETTDLVFAVDSIPAIFAITADPFLVFTSNVFAILGLRSLYFALASMIGKFRYLKISLALVLVLIGLKMMAIDWLKAFLGNHFNFYLLGVVLLLLSGGVIGSIIVDRQKG